MAKAKIACKMVPNVPGTSVESKLYIDLSKRAKNRPLANYLYAYYLQPGVADAMDKLGYLRDRLGQHKGSDVYDFLGGKEAKALLGVREQSKSYGFMDSSENLVDFDGEDAYRKAQDFNDNNKNRVAYVIPHGDKFNILLDDKNSLTQYREAEVKGALVQWDTLKDELRTRSINIDELSAAKPSLMNPGAVEDFFRTLNILQNAPIENLSSEDIQFLLALNPTLPIVTNLVSRGWGTTEEISQKLYDVMGDVLNHTPTEVSFVENVLRNIKSLRNLNIASLRDAIADASFNFETSDMAATIRDTINDLNEHYKINQETFERESNDIEKMSEAYADAAMSLERQIRRIEREKGTTPKSDALRKLQDRLLKELNKRQYGQGLLEFMNTAVSYMSAVNTRLSTLSPTGTNLERAHEIAATVSQANNLRDAYYDVINAIASNTKLINDFVINDTDRNNLIVLAKSIKNTFDEQAADIRAKEKEAMIAVGTEYIGTSNSLYAKDLVDIINMKEADSTISDYLYSVGRSSVATISMVGGLVRDEQLTRNRQAAEFDLEIRKATNLLPRGRDTSFMYDNEGRIVSQYDWDTFNKARGRYSSYLIRSGLSKGSIDYLAEMQLWEDKHTQSIEVDHKNHRFEKVPIYEFAGDFQKDWTPEMKAYYDRIMEIKGQIGTLLPAYAQHQYLAPQKRTDWMQIVKETLRGDRDFSNITKTLLDRANILKKKAGTDKFVSNGLYIDGEEAIASTSAYDNTILRQIPLFFTNKLDTAELSHDFSSSLTALMTTAVNYKAMDNIKDLCELIEDYVENTPPIERDSDGKLKVDTIVRNASAKVATALHKKSKKDGTSAIIDGFLMKHIYGIENRSEGLGAVLCGNLIGYTSLKGLAVNVKGALTNKYVGVVQTLIEAFAGQYYNLGDWFKAEAILLGEQGASTIGAIAGGIIGGLPGAAVGLAAGTLVGVGGMYGKFMDILTNNKNSKDTLIADFFDTSQEYFSSLADKRYHSTMFGRLFGSASPMAMYQRGEYWIHMMNVYSTLMHEKVISYDPKDKSRKEITLYEALIKKNAGDENSKLELADNIFRMDGVKINGIEDPYFNALTRRIRYINQQCHGSMNKEDKGLIHQYMLGKLVMNFRQWMVEHYSRRWRGLHWDESIRDVDLSNFYHNTKIKINGKKANLIDALEIIDSGLGDGSFKYGINPNATDLRGIQLTDASIDEMLEKYAEDSGWRRGFKVDTFVVLRDFIRDFKEYNITGNAYWDKLSETQKADVKRTVSEVVMIAALSGLSFAMGDPNDHRGEFFYRLWLYVVKRCLFDERATTALFLPLEAKTIINNPIAGTQTLAGLLYPIYGLYEGDFHEEIQTGRYKGWNKGLRNTLKYTVPFWGQIDQLMHIDEENGAFTIFENQITR